MLVPGHSKFTPIQTVIRYEVAKLLCLMRIQWVDTLRCCRCAFLAALFLALSSWFWHTAISAASSTDIAEGAAVSSGLGQVTLTLRGVNGT